MCCNRVKTHVIHKTASFFPRMCVSKSARKVQFSFLVAWWMKLCASLVEQQTFPDVFTSIHGRVFLSQSEQVPVMQPMRMRSVAPHICWWFDSNLSSLGRLYLSQIPSLLRTLLDSLKTEEKDSLSRENVLGALEKLSLRYSTVCHSLAPWPRPLPIPHLEPAWPLVSWMVPCLTFSLLF